MSPTVSVIIPVYNSEKYLKACLDSLLAQDTNFEAILIDDGSTDNSGRICDEYAAADYRFKVIHSTNGGPANARNIGLEYVQGEWVTFVDADDFIEPGYLNICDDKPYKNCDLIYALKGNFDGKTCTYYHWKNEGEIISDPHELELLQLQALDIYSRKPIQKISSMCAKFYKIDIVKNYKIKFPVGLYYSEDAIFMWRYLEYANSVGFITSDKPRYIIRYVESSLMQQTNPIVIEKRLKTLDYVYHNFYASKYYKAIDNYFLDQVFMMVNVICKMSSSWKGCKKDLKGLYSTFYVKLILKYNIFSGLRLFANQRKNFLLLKSRMLYWFVCNKYLLTHK